MSGVKKVPTRSGSKPRGASGKKTVKKARKARKARPAAADAPGVVAPADVDVRSIALPTRRKPVSSDIRDYSVLLYTPPKWGKSTMFSTFPEVLFLTCEPGTKGLSIFEFNHDGGGITSWRVMLRAVELLEKSRQFKNVVIDTAEIAYELCTDFVCQQAGIEHPHDADDYGKTWNKVNRHFRRVLFRLQQTGRGLYLTAHSKEIEIKPASGQKYTKISPQLGGKKATIAILGFVDLIWYGEFLRDDRRLVITRGNDLVTAGSRKRGVQSPLPRAMLLPENEDEDYAMFAAAFRGEVDKVEAYDMQAARDASKGATALIKNVRTAVLDDEDAQARGGDGD